MAPESAAVAEEDLPWVAGAEARLQWYTAVVEEAGLLWYRVVAAEVDHQLEVAEEADLRLVVEVVLACFDHCHFVSDKDNNARLCLVVRVGREYLWFLECLPVLRFLEAQVVQGGLVDLVFLGVLFPPKN